MTLLTNSLINAINIVSRRPAPQYIKNSETSARSFRSFSIADEIKKVAFLSYACMIAHICS